MRRRTRLFAPLSDKRADGLLPKPAALGSANRLRPGRTAKRLIAAAVGGALRLRAALLVDIRATKGGRAASCIPPEGEESPCHTFPTRLMNCARCSLFWA